ncbi:MAG: IPT/TIG domain-containing protein [Deltaproteobacteria bacterium]|nr:IPT/TIG domain-containing protein [Deltaproteobacteria bacterium]
MSSISPTSAAPGSVVTIRGGNFKSYPGCAWTVTFPSIEQGTINASFAQLSETQLRVTVPARAGSGMIRIVPSGGSAVSVPIVVLRPARVRIENSAQLDIIDVRANGVDILGFPLGVEAGGTMELDIAAGTTQIRVSYGWFDGAGNDVEVAWTRFDSAPLGHGQRYTIAIPAFTIGTVMTNWSSQPARFASDSFLGNDGQLHAYEVIFQPNGSWVLRELGSTQVLDSGTATLARWNLGSDSLTFRFKYSADPIAIGFPYAQFLYSDSAGTLTFVRR